MAADDADTQEAQGDLAAGPFSSWMTEMGVAIRGDGPSDVPCAGCTACCTSSQFVHIAPDETETLAHIPAELLFPAPRAPQGHVLMGYDERGHCPMLIDNKCSIYEHRPQTCRTYDCRVFSAAGIEITETDKALIAQRVRRWRFDFPTQADRNQREAVRAAATFLARDDVALSDGHGSANETQRAVSAVEIHHLFLAHDEETGGTKIVDPDPAAVREELRRRSASRRGRG